ncbi:hypothetical protein CLIB1423_02S11342 [[Candida] railenensis]|uniref:Uncharacterized protein n=1 Tax=[Candida] railenensis TaxID=45579 RepID=A0A9P0VWQ4_9ASCO|nr:hypothetical protein CLIB1423_02S11342 [[Candida] railenensis]
MYTVVLVTWCLRKAAMSLQVSRGNTLLLSSKSRQLSMDETKQVPVSLDSESEDDFDDFNEYTEKHDSEPNEEHDEDDDIDQDFGPVDQSMNVSFTKNIINLDSSSLEDSDDFNSKLNLLLNELFPEPSSSSKEQQKQKKNPILTEKSEAIYGNISELPRLKPPNWIKSKIRRNLLIKLGVPVNLDEVLDTTKSEQSHNDVAKTSSSASAQLLEKPVARHRRSSSVSELDIKWDEFTIPKFQDLQINSEQEQYLLNDTSAQLAKIEIENLDHSSIEKLLAGSEDDIDQLLAKYETNHAKLIELSSLWQNQLNELKKDYEIFESVVQNLVGHTQRLKREEIMANLNKIKLSKKKSHRVK